MRKIILSFTVLLGLFALNGCASQNETKRYSRTTLSAGFDTAITLHAYCESQSEFDEYFALAEKTFLHYNRLFDNYHTYEGVNNVKTINDHAGKEAISVDAELFDLIVLAKEYARLSDQRFDISYGAVLSLWHDAREAALADPENAQLPDQEELETARAYTGFAYVELEESSHQVYLNDPRASLDLGGIAKGYAAQKCAEALKEAGLKSGIVDAGGNVKLIGTKPEGDWNVGIQIPDPAAQSSTSLLQVALPKETSLVTSGDYQRYFEVDGVRYHHIIDPATAMPATYARSVTVICEDSTIADILSTTLFTMSYEEGLALIENLKAQGIQAEAIWVYDDTCKAPSEADRKKSGDYEIIATSQIQKQITYQ